jgi:hypothetical protein
MQQRDVKNITALPLRGSHKAHKKEEIILPEVVEIIPKISTAKDSPKDETPITIRGVSYSSDEIVESRKNASPLVEPISSKLITAQSSPIFEIRDPPVPQKIIINKQSPPHSSKQTEVFRPSPPKIQYASVAEAYRPSPPHSSKQAEVFRPSPPKIQYASAAEVFRPSPPHSSKQAEVFRPSPQYVSVAEAYRPSPPHSSRQAIAEAFCPSPPQYASAAEVSRHTIRPPTGPRPSSGHSPLVSRVKTPNPIFRTSPSQGLEQLMNTIPRINDLPMPTVPTYGTSEPISVIRTTLPESPIERIRSVPPPPPLLFQPSNGTNPNAIPANTNENRVKPDYASMSESQQNYWRRDFSSRFETLRRNNPTIRIDDPSEDFSLDQVHDHYEKYVKQIKIMLDSNQWKTYLVIFFLSIEVFGVKILGLNFSGYTMSQLKIINRYEELLIELGEQQYVQGGSNWPIEARILIMCLFNALIFILVKYLSKWLGGDSMAGTIQTIIDSLLIGTQPNPTPIQTNNIPVTQEQGQAPTSVPSEQPNGGGPDIMGMIGSLFGGGGGGTGGGANLLASLGTMFTQNMQNQQQRPAVQTGGPRHRTPVWTD